MRGMPFSGIPFAIREDNNMKLRERNYPISFMIPGILLFTLFFLIPFFVAFGYSFTNWNFQEANFVGWKNYVAILTDPNMNVAFWNTFLFTTVTTFFKMGFGLILAVFLNGQSKKVKILRTIFFLPAVINTIAVGIAFKALMHPSKGIINVTLNMIGLDGLAQNWLTNKSIAIFSVCAVEVWKWTGYTMMILLAGLQMVPFEYYEAARIDGASKWQQFKYISFPLIRPSFNNSLILSIIGGLKVFDIILATTGGGPGSTTQVLNSVVYRSFSFNMQGQACAGTVILAAFVLVITLATYKQITKQEVDS